MKIHYYNFVPNFSSHSWAVIYKNYYIFNRIKFAKLVTNMNTIHQTLGKAIGSSN